MNTHPSAARRQDTLSGPRILRRSGAKRVLRALTVGLGIAALPAISQALTFNFVATSGTSQAAIDGFAAAGTRWSSLFTDNVTININIDFSALGAGILGQAGSAQVLTSFTNTKNALNADKTSFADNIAVANLQTGPAMSLLMNRTLNSPNGAGNATTFLDNDGDANNTSIRMNTANAKALGILAGNNPVVDASISFSTLFNWDFDGSDGITAGTFDFVGVATHEIGHALGFTSGVDILDGNSTGTFFRDDQFTYVSTLDLFRHSAESGAAIDWAADNRNKYFSIDGGVTVGPFFSNGTTWGDGRQASHWKDNLGIGIMDPTSAPGEPLAISANDVMALDVIGWNRASVPDHASSLGLVGLGVAALAAMRRRTK
ncbi:MAG: NF038122 family metalloprotease [Verrucomicrobia bacterium]|nr:NF038122 family metalloprotease [Verrucomicrobiota bacterium]